MGRALQESAAFELRSALEGVRACGLPVHELWLVGGAVRSPLWPRILAAVTGQTVSITRYSHGPALGAAMLAGRALGLLEAFPRWVTAQTINPDTANKAVYDEAYAAYLQLTERPCL